MASQIIIDTEIKSKSWQNIKNIKQFSSKICQKLILETEIKDFLKNKDCKVELTISLVSDAQIKKLNQQFRSKNKATDVLSFPFLNGKKGFLSAKKTQKHIFLGDIILSLETSRKDAILQEKIFFNHLTHLFLHSILHLIGHDHENKKDAEIMERIEIKILKKLGINNPYQC
jgi:probable rRNA maturation factor